VSKSAVKRPQPKGGSRKGIPNKATQSFKEAVTSLLEWGTPQFIQWMEMLDAPEKRLDYVLKFAEYAYPKYARVEHTGKDGGAIETLDITPEQRREALKRILNAKRS
jgi:hypothetical protein